MFWEERAAPLRENEFVISVLLSAFNEMENPYFWKTLDRIESLKAQGLPVEVIVGITPGGDSTLERLKSRKIPHVEVTTRLRAQRYNSAAELISFQNPWVILHHPRSLLDDEAFALLLRLDSRIQWGAFTHRFDHDHPLLSFTSWWSNQVRGDLKHIFYLDHCPFIQRTLFNEIGGVPALEVFEDTHLSLKLRKKSPPFRAQALSTTSAIRFRQSGVWTQAYRNQILKLRYFLGASHEEMNKTYEKDQRLNC